MIPAIQRLPNVKDMIDGEFYFILHAPRQSGKTTCVKALIRKINSEGLYYAISCSMAFLKNVFDADKAMDTIVNQINMALKLSSVDELRNLAFAFDSCFGLSRSDSKVQAMLNELSLALGRDLVVFFDEADCLEENPLILFLTQIREGYLNRFDSSQSKFPRSIALVGLRDIRDYLSRIRADEKSTGLASPFNITEDSLSLANFTREEIGSLYGQHTADTGQVFDPEAVDSAWHWTEGQPWLVNALAKDIVVKRFGNDFSRTVTGTDMDRAAQDLLLRNVSHFDSLAKRLKEPRVRRVVEAVVIGEISMPRDIPEDDVGYAVDLGLLKAPNGGETLRPSNPIYRELIVRAMTRELQEGIHPALENKWMDGTALDMNGLLKAFQVYWRENSEFRKSADVAFKGLESPVTERIGKVLDNHEIAGKGEVQQEILDIIASSRTGFIGEDFPHIVLFAFLQRVMNGGADFIQREYALGRTRADVCVGYKGVRYPLELKLKGARSLEDGLIQLSGHMDRCGSATGWLVVFDMNPKTPWGEKLYWETREVGARTVHVVGC
jgi:hypothetical protein